MDPDVTYYEMYLAMSTKDYSGARELAISLRDWLNNGGFWPTKYTQIEVKSYLASVLRRTK